MLIIAGYYFTLKFKKEVITSVLSSSLPVALHVESERDILINPFAAENFVKKFDLKLV